MTALWRRRIVSSHPVTANRAPSSASKPTAGPGNQLQIDQVPPRVVESRQRLADTRDLLTRTRSGQPWGAPGAAACEE
jgi:hypothetical protein